MTRTRTIGCLLVLMLLVSGALAQPNMSALDRPAKRMLEEAGADDMVQMVVFMAEQPDRQYLGNLVRDLPRDARSEVVWRELDNLAKRTQGDLQAYIEEQYDAGNVERFNSLRICNGFLLWATPDVIEEVSYRDDISWIHGDYPQPIEEFNAQPVSLDELDEITDNLTHINVPDAWEMGWNGDGILVAVMDTGVDYQHPDLADHLWDGGDEFPNHGYDFGDDDDDPMDEHGHGTHVAGTVCGDGTGGTQTGVAPEATLMCLKVQYQVAGNYEATMWAAMDMCIEQGVDVMNMSLGLWDALDPADSTWRANFELMDAGGVISCVAAGNEGGTFNPPISVRVPGTCPSPWRHPDEVEEGTRGGVICVGAVDTNDDLANFSSIGPVTWQDIPGYMDYPYGGDNVGLLRPDVTAVGVNVTSLAAGGSGYTTMSGTSMAAPATVGTVALMLHHSPGLTTEDIDSLLQMTSLDLGDSGKDNSFGAGRIDAYEATMAGPSNYGFVAATVRNANTLESIPSVLVNFLVEADTFDVRTDTLGQCVFPMPPGSHGAFVDHPPYAFFEYDDIAIDSAETTAVNFDLPVGLFAPSPDTLAAVIQGTEPENHIIMVSNTGTAPMDVSMTIEPVIDEGELNEFLDERYSFTISDVCGDNAIQGIEGVGPYLYVTGSNNYANPNYIYKLTTNGEFVQSFEQPGSNLPGANNTGMRDLAYDGTYLYGSYDHRIMVMNPENCQLVRTIEGPFDRHTAIAYDPTNGLLWVTAGNQDLVGLDPETGDEMARFACGLFVGGMVYNPLGEDGYTMLLAGKELGGSPLGLYQINPDSQFVDYYLEIPGLPNESLAGLGVTPIYDTYFSVLSCLLQHPAGDRLAGFELRRYVPFADFTPEEFSLDPGETQDVIVTLDYVGYENGIYEAHLKAQHNTLEDSTVMPILMTVALGVEQEETKVLPTKFSLHAPYPNPFNGTTMIAFDLPRNEAISLTVFDVLGREVARLTEQPYTAGTHRISFNGATLSSGMYFLRMQTESGFIQSRKLLLLK